MVNGSFGPDRDISWYEAEEWINSLGENWGFLPRDHLISLQCDGGISTDNWGYFQNSGNKVWSTLMSSNPVDVFYYHSFGDFHNRQISS